jgi:type I restriction enzyme S subunit
VNDKVDPSVDDIERFVAGEHMDTDEQKIFRFGNVGEGYLGPAFHMRFKPGHILYGSRRTYLRKVAMADFEGVCSNTTFVIAPSDDRLDASYLLNVMSTERFHQNSISLSKGSTNPYINFSDLAAYEFELPSIEEQQRIVELLSGVDAHAEALRNQLHVANETRKSVLRHLLTAGGDDWTETTLGKVGESGFFSDGDWVESKDQDPKGNCRLVQLADIGDGMFLDKSDRWLNDEQFLRLRCTALKPRDILIARMPDPAARACLFPDGLPKSATVVDVAILRCSPDVLPEFLMPLINDSTFRNKAISLLTGTTRQRIARSKLASIAIFLPPLDEQQRIVDEVSKIDAVIQETTSALAATRQLRSALLNKEIS